ncbi:MAG: DUF6438 domain-containing protein [Nitrososphaeraceae archaeon]
MKLYENSYAVSIVSAIIFVSGLSLLVLVNNVNGQTSDVINNQSTINNMNQSNLDTSNVNITMFRGACFGACPIYYLEINGDGKVIYRGYEYVNVTGERTSSIPVDKVKELVNQFNNSGYFNLKDRYDEVERTDQSTVVTTISMDGTFKSVYDYLGTTNLPELQKLRQLENMIDEVTNSSQWVGLQVSNSTVTSS